MKTLGERIRELREARGWTLEDLSSRSGVEVGTISALEVRKSKMSRFAAQIAKGFGISLDQLNGVSTTSSAFEQQKIWFDLDGRIPVVGHAQLGDNGHFVELEYPAGQGDGFVILPARDKAAYALRCEGSSMVPRIRPGEYVVVEPSYEPAPGDEVVVKSTDGRVMVKVYLYWRDDHLYLGSINNSHPMISLDRSEVAVMHRVFAIVNRFLWIPE